jgi:hypothetical protein
MVLPIDPKCHIIEVELKSAGNKQQGGDKL